VSGFLWGVSTSSFQVEGGLNGPGQPANNWEPWDRSGHVEPTGEALKFWTQPDELLDRAADIGCNAFRISIEWARVQPSSGHGTTAEWDEQALDRYADILLRCRQRGLEPVVTICHYTHPLWFGQDLWLDPRSPEMFEGYARGIATQLGRLMSAAGQAPIGWFLTLNEPGALALGTHLLQQFAGVRRGVGHARTAVDNLLAAHIRAYDAIHEVYESSGWPSPMVSTNSFSTTISSIDAIVVDTLLARERGVAPPQAREYLKHMRRRARARLAAVRRGNPVVSALDRIVDRLAALVGPVPDGAAFRELFASPRSRKLDFVALVYYDPVVTAWIMPATGEAARLRTHRLVSETWERRVDPDGLAIFLRQAHLQAPDRPILVTENGMSTPGFRARPDGMRRDVLLDVMCGEVIRARDEGLPIAGYLHWTIADNYELGSYHPRFGLHGVDRRDGVKILDCDATGVDAAGAYRRIIKSDSRGALPPDGPPKANRG
jgi:beta-glucosidase/6-phospho-beta-glucosidase/beta-galactosidase